MDENQKVGSFKAKFNSLSINENDPTIIRGKVIVHGFDLSENGQVITEEICVENMSTLIGKRLVCRYIPSEENDGIDALTDHEETIGKNRLGEDMVITNTLPIGFIENVCIDDYTDREGVSKRVLFADIVLWNDDKYKNVVGLLKEWLDNSIQIHMSVEYLYMNYSYRNNVEYIESPIVYVAHTFLNSEQRGDYAEVLPAYNEAELLSLNDKKSWNKAINQCIKKSNAIDIEQINKEDSKKEDDKMENKMFELLKSTNAISASSIRYKIYDELAKVMLAVDYENVYIGEYDVFPEDHYFLLEVYKEGGYKLFKCNYAVGEGDVVTVDYANAVEVEYKYKVELAPVEEIQASLNAKEEELKVANDKIVELEKSLNSKIEELGAKEDTIKSLNEKVETVESEKVATIDKFNSASDTIVSLNSKVDELSETVEILKPLADKYNEEQYTKALNSAVDSYKVTFNKAGVSLELLEEESTMELIKKTLNSKEDEVKEAKFQLNQLIIDNMTGIKVEKEEEPIAKSVNSVVKGKETKGLVDNFVDPYEEFCGFSR